MLGEGADKKAAIVYYIIILIMKIHFGCRNVKT